MPIERGNTEHSPRVDDALAHETESLTRGAPVEARAEEWREQEGPAEGEPLPQSMIQLLEDDRPAPNALPTEEVDRRSELAQSLRLSAFPADRDTLVAVAEAEQAPLWVLDVLRHLPDGREFANVQDVWTASGGGREARG